MENYQRKILTGHDFGRATVILLDSARKNGYIARFWQENVYHAIFPQKHLFFCKNLRKKCKSYNIPAEKCLYCKILPEKNLSQKFRQRKRLYCTILAEKNIRQNSGRTNDYIASFWQKKVNHALYPQNKGLYCLILPKNTSCNIPAEQIIILYDSDRKMYIMQYFGRANEYMIICKILPEKCLSCKILAEQIVILQDPGRKKYVMQYSGRTNGYIARFWQKIYIMQYSGRTNGFYCEYPAEKIYQAIFRQKKRLSCIIQAEKRYIMHYSGRTNGYIARIWLKNYIIQYSDRRNVILQDSGRICHNFAL